MADNKAHFSVIANADGSFFFCFYAIERVSAGVVPVKTLIQLLVKIAAVRSENPDGLMHKSHKLTTASSGSRAHGRPCVFMCAAPACDCFTRVCASVRRATYCAF